MFFPSMCEPKASAAVMIILYWVWLYAFAVCCLFYVPIAFFISPLSTSNFTPPSLLPHLAPVSTPLSSSSPPSPPSSSLPCISSSPTSSSLAGPLWQSPLLFLSCLIFSFLLPLIPLRFLPSTFLSLEATHPLWKICVCVCVSRVDCQTSFLKTEGIKIDQFDFPVLPLFLLLCSLRRRTGGGGKCYVSVWYAPFWWRRRLKEEGT